MLNHDKCQIIFQLFLLGVKLLSNIDIYNKKSHKI